MNIELFQKWVALVDTLNSHVKIGKISEEEYCNVLELAIEKMRLVIAGGTFRNGGFGL